MNLTLTLETQRLILKTSNRRMLKDIMDFHIRNKEFFRQWEAEKSADFYTKRYQLGIIRAEKEQIRAYSGIDFWLYDKENNFLMGKVSIFGIMGGNYSNCMAGYKLDEAYVGKGYMQEALDEVVRFMFEDVNIHRMEINIMPRNVRSIHVAEKLGFAAECESREFVEVNGVWENHLRFVKINEHWKK